MKKTLLLACISLFFASQAFSQARTVRGKVISSEDGQPMPGVNVVIQGTTKGTSTDVEGNYALDLAPGETTLSFTFVGYKTQTVEVGQREVIDITLESDATALEEVVVIGYGTVRKSDLTGSVSSIRGSDLTTVPSINPMQSLQGKVAGVQVSTFSGAPGSGSYVRIRGIGTFNDSSPIYVVDGVIVQNIDYLNASDITSMQVLKDASATAIYGSRGANGVIMVTTKKGTGTGNEYPAINFSAEYSIQDLPKKIDLLDGREFAIVANEIIAGSYNNVDAVPKTDWQDLIFETAPIQNYQVSASGGSDKFNYYLGLGYFKQDGIITKSNYERVSLKFNNQYSLSKSVRFGANLSFTPFKQQNTAGNAVFVVYRAWPTLEPFQPDGSYTPVPGVGNVLADIENTNSYTDGVRTVDNLYAEVDFLNGFTFKSSLGIDFEYRKNTSYTPVFYVNPQQQNAVDDLRKSYFDKTDWLWENTLSYRKEIDKHRIDVVAGYTMQESSSENVGLLGQNLLRPGEDFWYINPNNINPNEVNNNVDAGLNFSMLSLLFRANYTFNDKYLFTATFRRDGSSKFTPQNRYANFPSFAVGWNAINEAFVQNLTFLSNLKLRASWGIIGNEKIPYSAQYSLTTNANAVFGIGDTQYPGTTYDVSGNPNLKWESTYQTDIGLEVGVWEDRLTAEIDYYHRTTKDILVGLSVPGYLGNGNGATIIFNAAEVLNKGVELNLKWESEVSGIRYSVGAVATTIHNETLAVSGTGGDDDKLEGFFNGQVTNTTPGLPIGAFYGYQVDGVFQNQTELDSYPHDTRSDVGDLRFVDTDNNGVLNGDDRTYLGSPIPKLLYGFNIFLEYKGFDLSIDFQGQSGNKIYNGKETVRPDPYNFESRYFNYWDGEGTSNSEPRPSYGGVNYEPSSRYIYDGSFFRLRNASIGYTIPQSVTDKISMKSARVYVRGTNIFTLSDFTGYTPEIVSNNPIVNGIDVATYPVPRIFSVGLNVSF